MFAAVPPRLARRRWLQVSSALAATALAPALLAAARSPAPLRSLQLSLNENPFGPSPLALEAIRKSTRELWRYTGREAEALVDQLARREGVAPEQILLGEVLEALGRSLALEGGPGAEFIYSEPGYTALVDAAHTQGGVGIGVPLDAELRNNLPALESKLSPRTRAVFLVNPHNPSGTVSDAATMHEFVRRVGQRTAVIVDEAYLEYTPEFAQRTAVSDLVAGARVIVFRTFTKFYGLAALPLGYAVLPRGDAASLRKLGLGAPRSQNRLAIAAAAASLQDAAYANRVRRAVATERARWSAVLQELGLRHSDAQGSFVFFETGKPQPEVAAAFAAQGIDIGRAFPPLERWARISIGLPDENARAQAVLRRLLAS